MLMAVMARYSETVADEGVGEAETFVAKGELLIRSVEGARCLNWNRRDHLAEDCIGTTLARGTRSHRLCPPGLTDV